MTPRRALAVAAALATTLLSPAAFPAPAALASVTSLDDAGTTDAADLLREIDELGARVGQELSTHACDEACRALTSMLRAADRLCHLEPGDRCTAARARCAAATQRVGEACPECAVAASPSKDQRAAATEPSEHAPPSPAAEAKRGGCASCTTAGGSPVSADLFLLALALAALRRRPARRP